jgi:phosphatidylglycerol:prolipoprotein diacylglycerol transferase
VDTIALKLGPFTIHWFGILVAAGFAAGMWTAGRRGVQDGLPRDAIVDMGPWLILGAVAGARLVHVATYWQEAYAARPWAEIFMVQNGGLVFYGGLAGGVLAGLWRVRRRGLPVWKSADALAPGIALGSVLGRLGCFTNGCCHGHATDVPWAVCFPNQHATLGQPVHPAQLYDAALNLALFRLLTRLHARKRFDGQIAALFLVGYAVNRSFVELFRGDYPEAHLLRGLTPAHQVSLAVLATGLFLLWKLPRRPAAK